MHARHRGWWAACLIAAAQVHAQTPATPDADALLDEDLVEKAAPVYDIELIVFAYAAGISGRNEDFAYEDTGREAVQLAREALLADPGPGFDDAFDTLVDELTDPIEQAVTEGLAIDPETGELIPVEGPRQLEFTPLPPETFRLADTSAAIERRGEFERLLHASWRQPVYGPDEETSLDLERVGQLPPELGGTASIYVTRFLHLKLDLALADTRAPISDTGTLIYKLDERRKMRSTELHFFDHPRFGALALISRYEVEEEPVYDDTDVLSPGGQPPAEPGG
ncbi:MAG: CsiV family protein [Pseudomonadota bacterium]